MFHYGINDSLRKLQLDEFRQTQRRVFARTHSTEDYWLVQRHIFDRTINCGEDSAAIFDKLHSDSAFRSRFYNLLAEHRRNPVDLMASDINECGRAAMANKRGRALAIVRQLCDVLDLNNSHDVFAEIKQDKVAKHSQELLEITAQYAEIFSMRDWKKENAKHRCQVTAAMSAAGRVFYQHSGYQFHSVRREGAARKHVWQLAVKPAFSLMSSLEATI